MCIEVGDGEIPTVPARRRWNMRESGHGAAGRGRGGRLPLRRPGAAWLLAVGIAGLDLASKAWAFADLRPLTSPGTGFWLRVGLVINRGATFGVGAGNPGLVLGLSAAVILALGVWLWRATRPVLRVGLALVLGGGLGNLVDRLAQGAVTDWIHVAFYPATFNIADVAIRTGLLVVLVGFAVSGLRRGAHRPRRCPAPAVRR